MNDVTDALQDYVRWTLRIEPALDIPWKEIGITSMDMIYLAFWVEQTYGVEIPDAQMPHIHTLRDVVALIEQGS